MHSYRQELLKGPLVIESISRWVAWQLYHSSLCPLMACRLGSSILMVNITDWAQNYICYHILLESVGCTRLKMDSSVHLWSTSNSISVSWSEMTEAENEIPTLWLKEREQLVECRIRRGKYGEWKMKYDKKHWCTHFIFTKSYEVPSQKR